MRSSTFLILSLATTSAAQIPKPTDAPAPLSPAASAKTVVLPRGFKLDLLAAEPLIRQPSGMCWDERGRLYVCELHGYNLEGQLDVDELNRTGKLDREVRRYMADPKLVEAARKDQYGTVKRLTDTDGDGVMDQAVVLADRLPPCYGLVPARGGVIVACAPDIVYLADRDDDGVAEVREKLFMGFPDGILERRISGPMWSADGWITFARGGGGATITGPHLKTPVQLPNTDFRIRADGTAIEPVLGGTGTIGFAFSGLGDRFIVNTSSAARLVAPVEWRYLARNPFAAVSLPEVDLQKESRCYPTSLPHPWRTQRAADPGFEELYRQRYGVKESQPNGFFTSLCSPMVYRDTALPGLKGHLFACEPAQNLITRAALGRAEGVLTHTRVSHEERGEFLTSTDVWFHPIALATAPDGSIVLADFYREIIEDYSAVPRYLQQQYGLTNGKDHGRLWRITHESQVKTPAADMSKLSVEALAAETISPHVWRRETANRLLRERAVGARELAELTPTDPEAILNVAFTLESHNALPPDLIVRLLHHAEPSLRVQGLRFAERRLNEAKTCDTVLAMIADPDPAVRLQLALTLGECRDPRAMPLLAKLAREQGRQRWMAAAIQSSAAGRSGELLAELLRRPKQLGDGADLLAPLAAGVAARRDPKELGDAFIALARHSDVKLQLLCLKAMKAAFKAPSPLSLADDAKMALRTLSDHADSEVRMCGDALQIALRIEEPDRRAARLKSAAATVKDPQAALEARLAAVSQLAFERDAESSASLLAAAPVATPRVRDAILESLFAQRDRHGEILAAIESKSLAPSLLTSLQRAALAESPDAALRERAKKALTNASGLNDALYRQYAAALEKPRNAERGQKLFRERCGTCHQAHGLGIAVGPNLSAEFQRAEATILRDLLAPNDAISAGFTTYAIETAAGETLSGLLAGESAGSVTLRFAEGKERVILRKDIERIRAMTVSLMPDDLMKLVPPQDAADIIAWLRNPPATIVLLDENPEIVGQFTTGKGTAKFITTDRHAGTMALEVTPLQRAAPKLPGWDFAIREKPGPGEFRYLRFAWKTPAGEGILIELAAGGQWPPAKSTQRRYVSGRNTSGWGAIRIHESPPREWTVVTVDLWKDFGNFKLTGFAPTALGGPALFDRVELFQSKPPR